MCTWYHPEPWPHLLQWGIRRSIRAGVGVLVGFHHHVWMELMALAALLAAVMGPFGVLIYLILRPRLTIDQEYQHTLEEEALLTEIEDESICPGCGGRTHADWQLCPTCHTHLRKDCDHCGRLMELSWQVCPYCGTPVDEVTAETLGTEI